MSITIHPLFFLKTCPKGITVWLLNIIRCFLSRKWINEVFEIMVIWQNQPKWLLTGLLTKSNQHLEVRLGQVETLCSSLWGFHINWILSFSWKLSSWGNRESILSHYSQFVRLMQRTTMREFASVTIAASRIKNAIVTRIMWTFSTQWRVGKLYGLQMSLVAIL